jgi:hypothetical protein
LGGTSCRIAARPEATRSPDSVGEPSDRLQGCVPEADYFAITQHTEEHTFNGQTTKLTYWHRPLHVMTDAFNRADFRVSVISEPPFSTETPRDLLPPNLRDQTAFLCFIFFVLEAR